MITDDTGPHVYLSGSVIRVRDHMVSVVGNKDDGSVVKIVLGARGVSSIPLDLQYKNVAVQRMLTTDDDPALVEAFSGPPVDHDDMPATANLPQFPVKEQADDKITVKLAANDSGEVMFEYATKGVTSSDTAALNTENSIPAGLTKEDGYDLIVTYKPDGDMSGEDGAGQFEIRIPSGWSAENISISGDEESTPSDGAVEAGDTITATLPEHFGYRPSDKLVITLVDITVPNEYGNQGFTARAKHEDGRLTPLLRSETFSICR